MMIELHLCIERERKLETAGFVIRNTSVVDNRGAVVDVVVGQGGAVGVVDQVSEVAVALDVRDLLLPRGPRHQSVLRQSVGKCGRRRFSHWRVAVG